MTPGLKETIKARFMSFGLPSRSEMRWTTAVHEAGHAVAAVVAHVPINEVTLDPSRCEENRAGQINYDEEGSPSTTMGAMAAEIAVLGCADHDGLLGDREHLQGTSNQRSVWQETYRLAMAGEDCVDFSRVAPYGPLDI
jgi:hypothetical protein